MLELGRRCCEPLVAFREPLIAFRECLSQVAKLLLPIRELAVALLHLTVLLVELPPRFRRGLLALPKLLAKLLEAALVGRQQLALIIDCLLALVQRDLERCPTGSGVISVLRQPTAQRLGVAS